MNPVGRGIDSCCAAILNADQLAAVQAVRPAVPPTRILDARGVAPTQLAVALEDVALEQHTAAARRVTADVYAAIRTILPGVQYHGGAQMLLFSDSGAAVPKPQRLPGRVAIVSGSSSDLRTAFEAKVALELAGGYSTMYQGVSAADLQGIVRLRESIADADAVIVCCGEQPALAGLLAPLVAVPVVAVPGTGRPDPAAAIDVAGVRLHAPVVSVLWHDISRAVYSSTVHVQFTQCCFTPFSASCCEFANAVNLRMWCAGVSCVAPDDGASAAAAASRTLRVAAQYIQYRKDREASQPVNTQQVPRTVYANGSAKQHQDDSGDTLVLRNIVPANGVEVQKAAA